MALFTSNFLSRYKYTFLMQAFLKRQSKKYSFIKYK